MAKISVLMATRERGSWILEAIKSCYAQEWPDFEILVMLDGDTSGTYSHLKGLANVQVFETKEQKGLSSARNALLRCATGSYINFLSDDNILCPGKWKNQVSFLERTPGIDVVYSDFYSRHPDGRQSYICASEMPDDINKILVHNLLRPFDFNRSISALLNPDYKDMIISDEGCLYRSSLFNDPFQFDENVGCMLDYDSFMDFILNDHKFAPLHFPAYIYNNHDKTMTRLQFAQREKNIKIKEYIYNKWRDYLNTC